MDSSAMASGETDACVGGAGGEEGGEGEEAVVEEAAEEEEEEEDEEEVEPDKDDEGGTETELTKRAWYTVSVLSPKLAAARSASS